MRFVHSCSVVLAGLFLWSACASTQLTVRKVEDGAKEPNGVRYSLPKPFLLVTPSPSGDGSLKVDVIYLPDTSNTYAIDGRTKRGKYELSVNVKDGLLSKVAWSQNVLQKFRGSVPSWGISESPLIDGDRLIVMPGGRDGSLVALNKADGALVWKSGTDGAGYSSAIISEWLTSVS